jgi:hypothetical protein
MSKFYELQIEEYLHLNEYHEYYFFTKNDHRWYEIARLEEYEHFDIRLLPFEGSEQIKVDSGSDKYRMQYPPQLFFSGNFETVERIDYPVVDGYQLPVISRKFLNLLESVKPFYYDTIPVTIFDAFAKDPFLTSMALKENVKRTTEYVYLKIKQFVMLDKDNSDKNAGRSKYFYHLEVFEPDEGLDPIFRIRQCPSRIFITEAIRDAIEKLKIKKQEENKIRGIRLYDGHDFLDYV